MPIATLAAGAAALALSAQASTVDNPEQVQTSFDATTLQALVTSMGWTASTQQIPNVGTVVAATAPTGMKFILQPTVCKGSRCLGVNTMALFPAYNANAVYAFSDAQGFVKAGMFGKEASYVSRYDIADGGYVRGNFALTLTNFVGLAQQFPQAMQSISGNTVSNSVSASAGAMNGATSMTTSLKDVNFSVDLDAADSHGAAIKELAGAFTTMSAEGEGNMFLNSNFAITDATGDNEE